MIRYYLVDDDESIINILKLIIEDNRCGIVCGSSLCAEDAMEDLKYLNPDIVIIDLLMPGMDGITFVGKAKRRFPQMQFIMLSQVSSKDMIAKAYLEGIEFYIQKPINSIEVLNVIDKVNKLAVMHTAFERMQKLMGGQAFPLAHIKDDSRILDEKINGILQKIGIRGDLAGSDILKTVSFIIEQGSEYQMNIGEICAKFSSSPKSMEQRMRRAVADGLVNLAHMGLEDYNNEIFTEYASTLYKFEQIRKEMDYIRGKSKERGKVYLKNFLYSLSYMCKNN